MYEDENRQMSDITIQEGERLFSEKFRLTDFAVYAELPNENTDRANDGIPRQACLEVIAEEETQKHGRRLRIRLGSPESQHTNFPFLKLEMPVSVSDARRLAIALLQLADYAGENEEIAALDADRT